MSSSNFGAPPSGIICHQGFMTKRGANYKTWRKRFFILLHDGYLIYFKEQEDLHHPLGIIYLQNAFLDRLSAEQCERNRPHSFVVRSTTRRFILCSETSSEKEDWIKNIERVIQQANARIKMMDTRSSVSGFRASDASPFQRASMQVNNVVDNVELRDMDREISKLEKKISDCILHSNSFESRIPDAATVKASSRKNSSKKTNKKNKNDDDDGDDDDDDDDDEDDNNDDDEGESGTSYTSSGSSDSDNEEEKRRAPVATGGRRRQNTIKSKSKRIANLEKLNTDIDKLMQTFVKMNSYLLALDKEKEKAEQDIKELKNHKKLLVKEVKNLREKLSQK